MFLTTRAVTVIFCAIIISAFENDFFEMGVSSGGKAISNSVKAMLNDGFSEKEIVKTIKSELGMKRINMYIEKMYDGEELTKDEIATMRSGEVEDTDEELADILEEFERLVESQLSNETSVRSSEASSDFLSEKDLVKELFREGENSSEKSDCSAGDNVPLPKPNYAYSPYDLIRLVKTEEAIYKPLKKYIKKMESKLKILKSYTRNYEDTIIMTTHAFGSKASFEDKAMAIVSNPISSYKMIRRFAFQLPEVWRTLSEDMEEDLWKGLSQVQMKHQPPNDQDWKEAIESLFRIQYYNGYNATQFSKGELGSIKSNVTLSAEECLEIGIRALALKKHDFALEWLYLAKSKSLNNKDFSEEVDVNFLEQTLKYAIKEHNKAWDQDNRIRAKSHVFTEKMINPNQIQGATKKSFEIRQIAKQFRSQEEYDYPIPYNFVSLCAGENLQTDAERSRLKCWLEHSKDPYFYINPLKIEILNTDPYLVQIYEVIGDKMISHVKKIAITKLQRSQVVNYNDPEADDISFVRTSSQTWIPQWHPGSGLQNLTKLIDKITGLTTTKHGSSEDFQVACYGTSHHYDEHLDAVQDARRTAEFGERIATFMLYLSTVDEGGKTAFPVLGVAANAIKGSAVFWYNLKKNGQPDKRTWHGGCPVVHGVKWVMNNWILYNENFQKRLCSQSPAD